MYTGENGWNVQYSASAITRNTMPMAAPGPSSDSLFSASAISSTMNASA